MQERSIHLKFSLSKTTELILTKFGRTHLSGMGMKVWTNQGADPFWAQKEATRGDILDI